MSQQPTFSPPQHGFQQPAPSGMSGGKIALIICGILGVLLVTAVGLIVYFFSQAMTDSDVMKTVVSTDQLIELDVPSNWNELVGADRSEEASLQYCNLFAETYGLVITEQKTEMAEALQVEESSYTLDDFTKLMTDYFEATDFAVGTAKTVTVNGLEGRRIRMATKYDGISIAYLVTFLEGESHFHQVHCWTLASREKRNMPTLVKVSDSLRER